MKAIDKILKEKRLIEKPKPKTTIKENKIEEVTLDSVIKDLCNHCKRQRNRYINLFAFGLTIVFGFKIYTLLTSSLSLLLSLLEKAIKNGMSDTFELLFISLFIYLSCIIAALFIKGIRLIKDTIKDVSKE